MPSWDPTAYLEFAGERARPFHDLIARVDSRDPAVVVDLGCGPGGLTARLAERWPDAAVLGVDSSPAMLERAREAVPPRVSLQCADVRTWEAGAPVDVLVANALLQWVPDHLALLRRWVCELAPGGVLAVQVPANLDAPSHALMRQVAAHADLADALAGVLRESPVHEVAEYADVLERAGCDVDAWETTYHHVLDRAGEHGDDAVLAWVRGTGLRPVLDALEGEPALLDAYLRQYRTLLREAYPRRPWGTVLPFRRIFVVARRR